MKHIIYVGHLEFSVNSELPYTHALIGQRDETHFKPPADLLRRLSHELTGDEYQAVAEYRFRQTEGFFATKLLAWAVSEAEAEAYKSTFAEPEWTGHRVVPVAHTFPNA